MNPTAQHFDLAPMSTVIAVLTYGLLAIPIGVLAFALTTSEPWLLVGLALSITAVFVASWVYGRPSRFTLAARTLTLEFPGRVMRVPVDDIREVRMVTSKQLKGEIGLPVRIGVGGLWGAFGWLWTSKRGLMDIYITRVDDHMLIERRVGRPLLLSAADPEALRSALLAAMG